MCVVRTGACVYMCGVRVCVCCVCVLCVLLHYDIGFFLLFPIYYELDLLLLQRSIMGPM